MKTPFLLFSSILLFLSGSHIFAQTISQDFIDGEVYIKLKKAPQNGLNLPNGAVNTALELPFLQNITNITTTLEAKRSFYFSNSADLQLIYRVKIAKPKLIQAFIKEITKDSSVEYAEPVPYYRIISTPNDPEIGNQSYLNKIKAFEAWDISEGGVDIIVAVVDNAIQTNHVDLAANMLPGIDISDSDYDPSPPNNTFSHGTHVAGLVGAVTNNNIGVASVGFNRVKILPIKVTPNSASPENVYHGFEGIAWAVAHGANIVNVSWGGAAYSLTNQAVINNAHSAGVIIIASAGNDGQNINYYPASYNHVVSVGSTTIYDEKSYFSNYGSSIDLMAPGSNIFSTIPTNNYEYWSGTSMAAPIVSSAFAYVWSVKPHLSAQELETLIKNTCDNIDAQNPNFAGLLGSGRINLLKAISCSEENIQPVITPSATSVLCPGQSVQLNCTVIAGANYQWEKNGQNIGSSQPSFIASETANYTVIVTKNTCSIAASLVKVSVVPDNPVISSEFTKACVGDSILLTAPFFDGLHYQWKKDGNNIGINNYRFYAKLSGNYTVTLSGNGCSGVSSLVSLSFIILNPVITADNSTILCSGQSTTLVVNAVDNTTYEWKKDNTAIYGATGLSCIVSEEGEYFVEQKLGQCVATSNKLTVVHTMQRASTPTITDSHICEGQLAGSGNELKADANSCVGALSHTYNYSGNIIGYDGNAQTGSNPSVTVSDMSTYVVNKVKIKVTFEKKDQIGLNDCDAPHGGTFPYSDEISFRVQSPNGTIITLLTSNTYNYYSYGGKISIVFEDNKPAIAEGAAPVSGTFAPYQPLSAFNGQLANGVWILLPNDNSSGDPLCVSGFSVEIQTNNVNLPNTFTWWTAPTSGQFLASGSEFLPTDTSVGSYTYYVQNQCAGVCPSERIPVNFTVNSSDGIAPVILAYVISPTLATDISPMLATANLISQSPATIKSGSITKIISDRAPIIDPITVCSNTDVLLLGTGCNGTYKWEESTSGVGIIVAPTSTTSYSVRCKESDSGCLSPPGTRNILVKPNEVTVTNNIPQKGSQTFMGNLVTIESNSYSPSATTIKANNSVLLKPGFSVGTNSTFTAQIEETCLY